MSPTPSPAATTQTTTTFHSNQEQEMKAISALSEFVGYLNDNQIIELTKAICAYVVGVETYEFSDKVVSNAYDQITEVIDKAKEISKKRASARKQREINRETTPNTQVSDIQQEKDFEGILLQQNSNKNEEKSEKTQLAENQSEKDFEEVLLQQNEVQIANKTPNKNATNVFSSSFPSSLSPTPPISLSISSSLSSIPPIIPQSENSQKEKTGKKKKNPFSLDPSTFGFEVEPDLLPIFQDWLQYKHERNEDYKPMGLKAAYSKLKNYSGGNPDVAREIITSAMGSNSMGFFRPYNFGGKVQQQQIRQQAMNPNERYDDNEYNF